MRILILGGNGFIGSHLIDGLLANGHDVRVLSHSQEKFRDPNPKVDYVIAPFENTKKLGEALKGIDLIFHLIWSTVPSTSNEKIITSLNQNVINTIRLIELMEQNDIRKIVFFSTGGAIYGNVNQDFIKENTPLFPVSAYGISKLTIEKYLNLFQYLNKIDALILRPSNPYGPRQNFDGIQGVISRFLFLTLKNKTLTILGDGTVVRDYIYIDDLVDLCLKITTNYHSGIYNVSSMQGYNLLEIVEAIKEVTGKEIMLNFAASRVFDVKKVVLDNTKTKKIFGEYPSTDIHTGIRHHWEWLNEYRA